MKAKLDSLKQADWVLNIRPVDSFVVSRYRQAWRTGAMFPPIIADKTTREIISGNHRWQSAMDEFGPDYETAAEFRSFKNRADALRVMAEENAKHGEPMDGITRRRLTCAMLTEGITEAEVAAILGVPVTRLERWGEKSVTVQIGKKSVARPVKEGIDVEAVKEMTGEQYEEHIERDQGMTARHMAAQLARWLRNGWVNMEDDKTAAAMKELKAAIREAGI